MIRVDMDWEGPFKLDELNRVDNNLKDYGIYQIYGFHPVYGSNVLMYIGLAARQTFCQRIKQEGWEANKDYKNIEVYVGRLCGETPSDEEWETLIARVEKLLIFSHTPASNQSNIGSVPFEDLKDLHIINWGSHRSLASEVTGLRWCVDVELKHFLWT
ncbi:hypothetical protein M3664_04435 [Paenibacillus lautus]|uniref:hypothetical protein n=1 Tax=Paenibacillus lautus TaxID=1401 RepID=UPI00203DA1B1|nr:hypothetical protein [Paenibacillus lautus]MCM3257028.1 hypothetical protein [Paenibacillus lautus]